MVPFDVQVTGNGISEHEFLEIFWGCMPPDSPSFWKSTTGTPSNFDQDPPLYLSMCHQHINTKMVSDWDRLLLFLLKLLVEIFLLYWEEVDAAQRVRRSMTSSFGIGRSLLWLANAPSRFRFLGLKEYS